MPSAVRQSLEMRDEGVVKIIWLVKILTTAKFRSHPKTLEF